MVKPVPINPEGDPLPDPAEDLSADDDLLSWILVDQLGCLPNTKLGVHPQQVKFVGPPFKTSEVLSIVKENIVKTSFERGVSRLLDFHLIKAHLDSKQTQKQKERFIKHLKRYLLPLLPNSPIEIFTTDRYSHITGHAELAVYATRALPIGLIVRALQGSLVRLPDAWRDEMDLGDDFAMEAAGDEEGSDVDDDAEGDQDDDDGSRSRTRNTQTQSEVDEAHETPSRRSGKRKEKEPRGARRSDRTKRRDFSIIWTDLKRCFQLFLGPARFLNHDCNPNVDLLRVGGYVTFKVIRPIKIGDEVLTFYGQDYFGKDNIECLCLSCEQAGRGGFTPKEQSSEIISRSRSESIGSSARNSTATRQAGPSALRNALSGLELGIDDSEPIAGPSGTHHDDPVEPATPRKPMHRPNGLSISLSGIGSPATESVRSEPESPSEDNPPKRERYQRRAARNAQHFSFLKRPRKQVVDTSDQLLMDEEDEDCVRCMTCAKALHERIWYNNKYFDHCARCVRHAIIYDLPWPAHDRKEVLDFPPPHLIPVGYIPPRVSSVPLPSLEKHRKKHVEAPPASPQGETVCERDARKFRQWNLTTDLLNEQLHEAAWTAQETLENQARAAEQARIDAKAAREAEKKKQDRRQKGSGVWARYEYIDEAELERRRLAKMALTTGTRRGGRFKPPEEEEEAEEEEEDVPPAEEEREEVGDKGGDESTVASPSRTRDSGLRLDHEDPSAEQLDIDNNEPSAHAGRYRQRSPAETYVKTEPSISPSKRADYRCMETINIDSDSEANSDDPEAIDDPTEAMIAAATRATEKRRRRDVESGALASRAVERTGQTSESRRTTGVDSDSDSDMREVKESTRPQKWTTLPKKPIPASAFASANTQAAGTDQGESSGHLTTLSESESPTKKARGRPRGSGKNQKAAILHAARAKRDRDEARPSPNLPDEGNDHHARQRSISQSLSRTSSESLPRSDAVPSLDHGTSSTSSGDSSVLAGIERMLASFGREPMTTYDWMIESIDHDGRLTFKSMGETGATPFPPEEIIRKYVDKEHGEFLRLLKPQPRRSSHRDSLDLANKQDRQLPGESRLVNRAEIKKWNPSRMMTPRPDKASTTIYDQTRPWGDGVEVVGYTVDTYACTSEEPSKIDGPWRKGQYRMIAARPQERGPNNAPEVLEFVEGEIVIAMPGRSDHGNITRTVDAKKVDKGKGKAVAIENPAKRIPTTSSPAKRTQTTSKSPVIPKTVCPTTQDVFSPAKSSSSGVKASGSGQAASANTSTVHRASAAATKSNQTLTASKPVSKSIDPLPAAAAAKSTLFPSPKQEVDFSPHATTVSRATAEGRAPTADVDRPTPKPTSTSNVPATLPPGFTTMVIDGRAFRMPPLLTLEAMADTVKSSSVAGPGTSSGIRRAEQKTTSKAAGSSVNTTSSQPRKSAPLRPSDSPAKASNHSSSPNAPKTTSDHSSKTQTGAVAPKGQARSSLPTAKPINSRSVDSKPAGTSSVASTSSRPTVGPKWNIGSPKRSQSAATTKPSSRDEKRPSTTLSPAKATGSKSASASAFGGDTTLPAPVQAPPSPAQRDGKRKAESPVAPVRKRPVSFMFAPT